jgi:general secretion pathway protein D
VLEDEGRVTSVATPILLVSNNEVSKVFVGEERPIVVDVDTETVLNNNVAVTQVNPVIETRNVGTTLMITPNINSDRTVQLRILQESSAISPNTATIPISTGDGDIQNFDVDVVDTKHVTGTVIAKDQLTLAVGGLIEERVEDSEVGIPILKDIPILNILFSNKVARKSRTELVILIRPTVVTTPEDAERASRYRLEALSIHPYRFGKEDSLETFHPEEVPGLLRPGPSWATALRLHQLGIMKQEDVVVMERE